MQDYRNLKVWKKAHELALMAYKVTANFPREEAFGLRHSIRKTAVDIPAYIAEGSGKSNDTEFAASINFALSLAMRLDYFALVARDLELIEAAAYDAFSATILEVRRMLGGFKKSLV
jgi:four helix bundle protein